MTTQQDWICGFKNMPVTLRAYDGKIYPTFVGLTYMHGGGEVLILEGWINPVLKTQIDEVDQTRLVAQAAQNLVKILDGARRQPRVWEGVYYG